ncbi:MAG: DNA repair protein RadA, partial [Bacteroidota bacterium]|nr:DNA repair protein RadA [Bacteroidota bacterium]MDX5429523.1 DNA repair protein RadA [Bacteroidota bacterium]MDX5468308.1 DNA repair protein RadA [Bacteroidota bacterium]
VTAAKNIQSLEQPELIRILTPDQELNRVLGGGLVPGSVILIGGEPGIGKSTLMLQLAVRMQGNFLYVSGEESESQIKMRADRIGIHNESCFVVSATSLHIILSYIDQNQPDVLIIDSVQTLQSENMESAPGTVSQIRECTNELIRVAKSRHIPVFLIGHITKEGYIAGPKVLEHMVDTVLQFEGDRHHNYRLLRASKNRFGSTAEIGIYEMVQGGLREVANPSEILISQKNEELSGICIGATIEGNRPILVETQALVSSAVYGTPQRNVNGYDLRRLNMLLAVLEKRCGFRLAQQDVFINITGGLKLEDPAMDLSIVTAILSSYEDIYVPYTYAFAGEIGLSGEVRAVSKLEQRIAEAEKLGFEKIFIAGSSKMNQPKNTGIEVVMVRKVEQLFEHLFG